MAKLHATAHQIVGATTGFLNVFDIDALPCGVGVWGSHYGIRTVLFQLNSLGNFALVQFATPGEEETFRASHESARELWASSAWDEIEVA